MRMSSQEKQESGRMIPSAVVKEKLLQESSIDVSDGNSEEAKDTGVISRGNVQLT